MRIVECVVCGVGFKPRAPNGNLCSRPCKQTRRNLQMREAYYANPEAKKAAVRRWAQSISPEKHSARWRAYYVERAEVLRERARQRYHANRDVERAKTRDRARKNAAILAAVKQLGLINEGDLKCL
jgi:hypothetical protein